MTMFNKQIGGINVYLLGMISKQGEYLGSVAKPKLFVSDPTLVPAPTSAL